MKLVDMMQLFQGKTRPRLLYFLVYKTADPNFWKMGKKIKSENRLFFKYFIPDRTAKRAKREKKRSGLSTVANKIK